MFYLVIYPSVIHLIEAIRLYVELAPATSDTKTRSGPVHNHLQAAMSGHKVGLRITINNKQSYLKDCMFCWSVKHAA
jgi:hypothetical protein